MAQICSSRFGNFFLSNFFFETKFLWKQCKRGGSGRTRAFQRALAKIHSKKFKFYTKHLTLRVYKKCFIGFWSIFTQAIYQKKLVCSVLLKCIVFLCIFFSIYFPKKVNKAIVTTQDPYTIKTLMYLQFLTYRRTVQNYWVRWPRADHTSKAFYSSLEYFSWPVCWHSHNIADFQLIKTEGIATLGEC